MPISENLNSRVSEKIGSIVKYSWAERHDEILVRGEEGFAVVDLAGHVIHLEPMPFSTKVIGEQRTPQGWRVLIEEGKKLSIQSIPSSPPDSPRSVSVLDPVEFSPKTCRWSPCGRYVAVGSVGESVAVWDTESGRLHWQRRITWDSADVLLTPPTLSVEGWSEDGKRIVTLASYLAAKAIFVRSFETGDVLTLIN